MPLHMPETLLRKMEEPDATTNTREGHLTVGVSARFHCPAAPATADGPSTATCSLNISLNIRPGLTLATQSGSIASDGQSGTLNCIGVINGGVVTGPGRFGVSGRYTGNCVQGFTEGTAPFSVPTSTGVVSGVATYTVGWVGTVGQVTATSEAYGFAPGPFAFLPERGDCVLTPLSRITWSGLQLVLKS
jgi:hypothetical protein